MKLSIEQKMLAAASVLKQDEKDIKRFKRLFHSLGNKNRLIHDAEREGLAGLLYKHLLKTRLFDSLNVKQKEKLKTAYYRTVRFNLQLVNDIKKILARLREETVNPVLMQGIALLHTVYEDIGLRSMFDADLWILKNDYFLFSRILIDLGYKKDLIYPNTFQKGSTTIDLSTHILWAERIQARSKLFKKTQVDIYTDSVPIDFEGEAALSLNAYDQVLYLFLHALKHNMACLIWMADIRNLMEDWKSSDWNLLILRSKELGQSRIVLYLAFLLQRIFNLYPPHEFKDTLSPDQLNILEKKALRGRVYRNGLPAWSNFILLKPDQGLKTQILYIFENLFPRKKVMIQIFSDYPWRKTWQLYIMRCFQLLIMALKAFRSK